MPSTAPQSASLFRSATLPRLGVPYRQALLLAAMAALLLVMPVSYRAGAETSHPHAVFQAWIDAAHGDPHHHHPAEAANHHAGDHHDADDSTVRWATGYDGVAARQPAAEADAPTLSPLKAPLSPSTPLLALVGVVLLPVASVSWRPLWAGTARLLGQVPLPELPPPRRSLIACEP